MQNMGILISTDHTEGVLIGQEPCCQVMHQGNGSLCAKQGRNHARQRSFPGLPLQQCILPLQFVHKFSHVESPQHETDPSHQTK